MRHPFRLVGAVAAVALLAVGCSGDGDGATSDTTTSDTATSDTAATTTTVDISGRVRTYIVSGRQHVAGTVSYGQTPPVGGDHAGAWQNCAFYSEPVVTERAVHSMEHGAVWITYRPDLPDAEVRALRAYAQADPYVLVSPWRDATLPAPVVASAWGVQLTADSGTDPAIGTFVERYSGGPQSPEPGAPCSGSVSTPG